MLKLNKFRSLVPPRADQGEVRCNSVATIITVIDAHLCARHKSGYPPGTGEGHAHLARTFLDFEKRSHFCPVWSRASILVDEIATLFAVFGEKRFLYLGAFMSDKKYTKEYCIAILQQKQAQLKADGLDRYPQRSDFEERDVVAIKANFGPWPRALEAAGIKPPRDDNRAEKVKEKRIRAKKARIEALRTAEREKKATNKD